MTTAIVGVGNIGSSVARHLVAGGEPVVLTAKDESRAQALAEELGPLARAASVEDAISGAEAVLLAVWLDAMRELIPAYADLLTGKVVIDPSNPSPVRYRRFRRLSVAWAEAERSPTATGWRSAASASNWPGTAATTRRTTPTSTSRPRHPHAGRHRPARLGAVLRHQPVGGRPRVYRGPGRRAGLPVEAPHRGAAWAGCAPATMSTCTSATLGRPAPDPLLPVKNDMGGERHGMAGAAAGF